MSWVAAEDIQAWIGVDMISLDAAASLGEVVTGAIIDEIERDLSLTTISSDTYDTTNTDFILLNYWPVRSIGAVTYNGQPVPAAAYQRPGWRLDPVNTRRLSFVGMGKLARGVMNVTVTNLVAGYDTSLALGTPGALPGNVFQALRLTAAAVFNSQAGDPNLASESTGGVFSGSFYPTGIGAVPPGARSLLSGEMRVAP